jgi:hypothetical protein
MIVDTIEALPWAEFGVVTALVCAEFFLLIWILREWRSERRELAEEHRNERQEWRQAIQATITENRLELEKTTLTSTDRFERALKDLEMVIKTSGRNG